MALPRVTAEVRDMIVAEAQEKGPQYLDDALGDVFKRQPALAEVFDAIAAQHENARKPVYVTLALMWKLLQTQEEVDVLERMPMLRSR